MTSASLLISDILTTAPRPTLAGHLTVVDTVQVLNETRDKMTSENINRTREDKKRGNYYFWTLLVICMKPRSSTIKTHKNKIKHETKSENFDKFYMFITLYNYKTDRQASV